MDGNKKVKHSRCLVTGGCGYIGSHTVLELLSSGFCVVILDNLDNSCTEVVDRIREETKCSQEDLILCAQVDLLDLEATNNAIVANGPFDCCIHFAALKAVGESVSLPLHYYQNNVGGTLNLLHVLQKNHCRNVVFSSSATVYGDPHTLPIKENFPIQPVNPYGRTKAMIEDILRDVAASQPGQWNMVLLRYFNPIGAHHSGRFGENPSGIPNNLLPFVQDVAVGKRPMLSIFGKDWNTPDGTGVRDYLHVVDLAEAHVAAVRKALNSPGKLGAIAYNIGTGKGTSVLEIIAAYEKASGKTIPYKFVDRRVGDVATVYADCSFANKELDWVATRTIDDCCRDSWKWISENPNGYKKEPEGQSRKGKVFQLYA